MKLIFGVVDVPYQMHVAATQRRVAVRRRKNAPLQKFSAAPSGGQTTGDIAEILEAKYHVMQNFYDARQDRIVKALEQDLSDFFEDRLRGRSANSIPFQAAESEIETAFREMIDMRGFDGLGISGVPTQASLDGVNHRLKHPYAKGNPPRPSFRDTGLYQQSFKVSVEE